ncbi:MAG: GHMP kinase [Armatimonadetes bacterium]|nr:GHMP kinase [Armatimonadota bacterium]
MIIVQTPLRISFAGGGTDFPDYYERDGGCVVSTAIDKYIYVIIKDRFDKSIRIGYSRTELVASVDDIEHELVREAMKKVGVHYGIEIATMADIPSEGSGLGSSSSVTVALLHALYTFKGMLVTPGQLAREACEIEIDILGKPIGKQDQYIAAYGGLRRIDFQADGTVKVSWIAMPEEQKRRFSEGLMLFYTGITRKADPILFEQRDNIEDKRTTLDKMKVLADEVHNALLDGNLNRIGRVMDAGWRHKKQLATAISNSSINAYYEAALDAGAIGGKVAGAGGGGFLLLFCPPDRQATVRHALASMQELPLQLERDGTKVILNARR